MKKLTLILLTILSTNLAFSQALTEEPRIDTKTRPTLMTSDPGPQLFIVIDDKKYKVDDIEESGIKTKWIESVTITNDDLSLRMNDIKKSAIFMYPEEKYEKRILRKLGKRSKSSKT
jgi:hypothetical protein